MLHMADITFFSSCIPFFLNIRSHIHELGTVACCTQLSNCTQLTTVINDRLPGSVHETNTLCSGINYCLTEFIKKIIKHLAMCVLLP